MSQWTHICGMIRVDGITGLYAPGEPVPADFPYTVAKVAEKLGPICQFDDLVANNGVQANCILPMGSKGSLRYQIIEYGTGMPWVAIAIWGDLRDFGSESDLNAVETWWKATLAKFDSIRDAVLRINAECSGRKVLEYDWEQSHI